MNRKRRKERTIWRTSRRRDLAARVVESLGHVLRKRGSKFSAAFVDVPGLVWQHHSDDRWKALRRMFGLRLLEVAGHGSVVRRVYADHFLILLPRLTGDADATALRLRLEGPHEIRLGSQEYSFEANVMISTATRRMAKDFASLLRQHLRRRLARQADRDVLGLV